MSATVLTELAITLSERPVAGIDPRCFLGEAAVEIARGRRVVACRHRLAAGDGVNQHATVQLIGLLDPFALVAWLNDTRELRGAEVRSRPPEAGEMGSVADVVAVALGGSGVAVVLIAKVYDWILLQRDAGSMTIKIVRPDGSSVEISVDRAQDRATLIDRAQRLLDPGDDRGA